MESIYTCMFSACVLLVGISASTIGRNNPQIPVATDSVRGLPQHADVRVIIKRDATDEHAELPSVDGRTFPASEPLNPNAGLPQQLVDDSFQTSHVIFEPAVDETDNSGTSVAAASSHVNDVTAASDSGSEGSAATNALETGQDPPGYLPGRAEVTPAGDATGSVGVDSAYLSGASYPIGSYDHNGQSADTGHTDPDTRGGRQYAGNSARRRYHGQGHRYDASGRSYGNQQRYYDSPGTYSGDEGRGSDGGTAGISSTGGGAAGGSSADGGAAGSQQYVDTLSGRYVNYGTERSQISSQISSEPVCRPTNTRVTINGLSCRDAISRLGTFVCYNYERVSDECCNRCLLVKSTDNDGCEYGDRSFQCRNIQPFDCYAERNRRICCDKCRQFQEQSRSPGGICVFGDLTPRCQSIQQRPYLCYMPENQRLCCETCPRLARQTQPDCRWGNQNPELCQSFDDEDRVKINCYLPAVQQVCCASCQGLRARMPDDVQNCEYGDSPVQFSTGRGVLDCGQYLREYGLDNCHHPEVAQKCCYTCYRYRAAGRG